ncbi:hypothetical protein [Bacillus sp. B-jedd]|uniref:hypothetical protein n=1 Tax=Bacillus sp. B-jedd TaxID=1476857 RepID=UPI00051555E0|nr:hypothetical protein [Bacillus sp. B-jedd]CEG26971.1 hypothetical protein BN1002_01826 [Bacillus sp. B-jedd]
MRNFIFASLTFILLLAGCQGADYEKSLPKAKFTLGSKGIETVTGSYTWSKKGKADEKDKGRPDALAKNLKAVPAAVGDTIHLNFSVEATSLEAAVVDANDKSPSLEKLSEGTFKVPDLSEGEHDILVKANFFHGHADYVFKINVEKIEEVATDFIYPQLLPEERHTYSMLAIGPQNEKEPLETNKQIIESVNEILSLETAKQAKIIYPELALKTDPCFILFDQKGPVFQSGSLDEVIAFVKTNKP